MITIMMCAIFLGYISYRISRFRKEQISITKHASKKCPNCGSPVQIKGTHWECGYCGNSGIMKK